MKKFYAILLAAIVSLPMMAQTLRVQKKFKEIAAPVVANANSQVAEGESLWGYYMGNENGLSGLGTGSAGTFKVAIKVPGGAFAGAKIQAINLPSVAEMTGVSVFGGTSVGSTNKFNKSVGHVGDNTRPLYTRVDLDTPVEIPSTGLYVGYKLTSTASYPIAVAEGESSGALYLATSATGSLDDYSAGGYGVSAIQLFLTDLNLADQALSITGYNVEAAVMGGVGTLSLALESNSNNAISSFDYTFTYEGVEHTGTKVLEENIPAGLLQKTTTTVEFDAPATLGSFPASFAITKVNGQDNETAASIDFTINTVTRVVPRLTVVEEFTGTGCGWCPRGWVGMEHVKADRVETAAVIAWHRYNSADAMYMDSYTTNVSFDGAPQCCVDRKTYPDPYYGEGEEGILACVDKYNTSVPTVAVEVSATYQEDKKKVDVVANTEFLANVSDYSIAFVLTADSLKGTTTAWKQSNYYASNYNKSTFTSYLPEMPELAEFCKGGKWGSSPVALVFNDVLIAHTYSGKKSLVTAFTAEDQTAGNIVERTRAVVMPTKAVLLNALDYEKVFVTAIVSDKQGKIVNAARARVMMPQSGEDPDDGDDTAIETVESADNNVRYYDLQGREVNAAQHGIMVKNGKKIMVK